MRKSTIKIFGFSVLVAVFSLFLGMMGTHPISAQSSFEAPSRPTVNHAVRFAISPPLRELAKQQRIQPRHASSQNEPLRYPKLTHFTSHPGESPAADNALQKLILPKIVAVPGLNLQGIPGTLTPEASLAVGTTQVVQMVNASLEVFNKTNGAVEFGPAGALNLWQNLGGPCSQIADGGFIVQWDKLAQRWLFANNATQGSGVDNYACFAVSTTSDATGAYYLYQFLLPGVTQYPKYGIWPDAYYQSQNNFGPYGSGFVGALACAYDRSKMVLGDPSASQICFQATTLDDYLLPADLDSSETPPAGEPEVFLGSIDNGNPSNSNTVYEYLFHVDFANPGDSTFTGAGGTMPITVAPFALACGGNVDCIPQLGTTGQVQALGGLLMYRLAYSNFVSPLVSATLSNESHQSWVVNHSVTSPGGQVGVRWYEFRSPENSTALKVFQQSTFAPDSNYRWMGSIAQDKKGDMLLGYSISSATMYPSINYTGRVSTDPLNTMETEAQMWAGTGSALLGGSWGDYTVMAVDSQDHCTFWYTNEYLTTSNDFSADTRLGSFKFPGCN